VADSGAKSDLAPAGGDESDDGKPGNFSPRGVSLFEQHALMAATARPRAVSWEEARGVTLVRRLEDRQAVRAHLARAPAYAAYALACLDARLFPTTAVFEARRDGATAVAVHSRGGLGPATLLLGDGEAISTLLRLHPGPRQTVLTCEPDHVSTALRTYHLWRPQNMLRMALDHDAFAAPRGQLGVRRLGHADAADLNRLYALEGEGLRYSGRQIDGGVYFGAFQRGVLLAAAGTHVYSETEGVAVVGNVFTHPDARGRGLGGAVTAAVTAHLRERCPLIVLSVDPANRAARRLYEKIGYREAGRLVESMATRRDPFSPLPALRRLTARVRGGVPGLEVVTP
jgi:ribosomal protein S18 acetylase RimI-like enzyme